LGGRKNIWPIKTCSTRPNVFQKKVDEENWSENWLSMFTWKKQPLK